MNFLRTYPFIFIFLCLGLCLPSASQSNFDSKASHQQNREEIVVRTMADLQIEGYGMRNQDQKSVLVLEKDIEEIPFQNAAVEVNVSQNHGITQKVYEDPTVHILKPRFEANWRYSNDRSILMGEFWLPLMQCEEESVVFCDIRLMGDDNENKEFNVGVGYREILHDTFLGDGVAGAMLWFDRRFTDRDFQFNQVTVGGEWLGEQYDLRMNGYFPINKKKSYQRANPNGSGQGFVGNQLLVNTDQVVVEEVLPGIDFELGSQLNFMNGITDSTRFFVGGYHFEADIAEDITGVRTRVVSDITSDVQVGARFQHDDVRGSQTYIESTIRFPFGHKKKYKHEGLWTRLDEAPERDIDVVSNEVVTVQGINEPLLNATTGLKQNVIHVDNTAAGGGDGSNETPYNTLAAAEGIATTNDLIYVHAGDGTTTNQNVGITLDDAGQMLAGSGTDLLYSTERFKTPNGNNITGALVEATTTPMITNGAGNGVDITADNVFVSGITVDGATSSGIHVLNVNNAIIDKVTSNNNTISGVFIQASGAVINQAKVTGSTANGNGPYGIVAQADTSGAITQVDFENNQASTNTLDGFSIRALSNSTITQANLTGNTGSNNIRHGVLSYSTGVGGTLTDVNLTNNTVNTNGHSGVYALSSGNGVMGNVDFTGNVATNNINFGFLVQADGVGSSIIAADFTNNTADSNGSAGVFLYVTTDGDITQTSLEDNTVTNNGVYGVRIDDNSAAGGIVADLGGGTFGSTGGNSISGSTSEELLVDLDGGALKAENNWWGSSSGLVGGETLLQDASTVDASPFLTSDPGL